MKNAWRRLVVYIRYDLREIIAPSSLPDTAGVQPERRLTLQEWRQVKSVRRTHACIHCHGFCVTATPACFSTLSTP
jgi:succinate dehydrogenase/fumarate reductase-like Fe-S protein